MDDSSNARGYRSLNRRDGTAGNRNDPTTLRWAGTEMTSLSVKGKFECSTKSRETWPSTKSEGKSDNGFMKPVRSQNWWNSEKEPVSLNLLVKVVTLTSLLSLWSSAVSDWFRHSIWPSGLRFFIGQYFLFLYRNFCLPSPNEARKIRQKIRDWSRTNGTSTGHRPNTLHDSNGQWLLGSSVDGDILESSSPETDIE